MASGQSARTTLDEVLGVRVERIEHQLAHALTAILRMYRARPRVAGLSTNNYD